MYNTNVNSNTLTCENITDRFAKGNAKGQLTYPIGLLTEQERALMQNKSGGVYAKTQMYWWLASPSGMHSNQAAGRYVTNTGDLGYYYVVFNAYGVRPAVTLSSNIEFTRGNGTYDSPYIVE
jgi:hypothetical protein